MGWLNEPQPDGAKIWFMNKRSPAGGKLDLDARRCPQEGPPIVENIVYKNEIGVHPPNGEYTVTVQDYSGKKEASVKVVIKLGDKTFPFQNKRISSGKDEYYFSYNGDSHTG